jgi:hypothetical protein
MGTLFIYPTEDVHDQVIIRMFPLPTRALCRFAGAARSLEPRAAEDEKFERNL